MFVEENGEAFENWNVQGLRQSGYLSRPHLQFNLFGAKNHLHGAAQGEDVRYKKNIELLYEAIRKKAEAWDGEKTREYGIHDLW